MTLPDAARWAQLAPLLDLLLDAPEPMQAEQLQQLRRAHPDLADELTALWADHQRAGAEAFLGGAVSSPPGVAHHPASAEASLQGQRLGPYVLQMPLGQGGGGSVWLARRDDGRFAGDVAIKLLHLSLMGHAGAERFRREGHILARLTHPNIARLLDAGVTPGGQPYLVLELVQGAPIDQHCNQRCLGLAERLALFEEVLAAVAHAHTHGVIHRDLKPANVLVTAEGQVKLLDFGIAKLLDDGQDTASATALTQQGGRALTPAYAAPEQLQGGAITTATDVYALGVMLYQLLCGHHPTSPDGGGRADEVMRGTLVTEPTRLSRRVDQAAQATRGHPPGANAPGADTPGADTPGAGAPPGSGAPQAGPTPNELAQQRSTTTARLVRALAGDLDNILAHALRKLPAERYPTVAALADELRRHRLHQPVQARPDSGVYRAAKFVRRNRGAVAAGALVALAITAGVVGTVWQTLHADRQRHLAQDQAELAEALVQLVTVALGPVSDKPITVADVLKRGEALADAQWAHTPRVQAFVQRNLAGLWVNGGDWAHTEALLKTSVANAQRAGDVGEAAQGDCMMGVVLAYQGKLAQGLALTDAALVRARSLLPDEPFAALDCLTNRSTLLDAQERYPEALADLDAATHLLAGQSRASRQNALPYLRSKRGRVLGSMGQLGHAIREYDAVLTEDRRLGRYDSTHTNPNLASLVWLLQRAGQTQRALAVSVELQQRQTGAGPGAVREPSEVFNHAEALADAGRVGQALAMIGPALLATRASGNERIATRFDLLNAELHCAYVDLAAAPAARFSGPACTQALQGLPPPDAKAKAKGASKTFDSRLALVRGQGALMSGQPEAARQAAEQVVQHILAAPWPDAKRLVSAYSLLAEADLAAGQAPAALAHARQAVAAADALPADFSASRHGGMAWTLQGRAQQALGDMAAARTSWREAERQLVAAVGADEAPTLAVRRLLAASGLTP